LCAFALLNMQSPRRARARTHTHTHTAKSVYEQEDVTVLWNQAVHTDGEVTADRSDIITLDNKI